MPNILTTSIFCFGQPFILLMVSFEKHKFSVLKKSTLYIFPLMVFTGSQEIFAYHKITKLLTPRGFAVLAFMFNSIALLGCHLRPLRVFNEVSYFWKGGTPKFSSLVGAQESPFSWQNAGAFCPALQTHDLSTYNLLFKDSRCCLDSFLDLLLCTAPSCLDTLLCKFQPP